MKYQNMTFSIPEDLRAILLNRVNKRGMSRFISTAIRKALTEEETERERELDAAYEAANNDSDRLEAIRDWNTLDDVADLVDENENWSWLQKSSKKPKKKNRD